MAWLWCIWCVLRLLEAEVAQTLGDVIHRPEGVCAACHFSDNIAVVLVLVKRAAKNVGMNHLLCTLMLPSTSFTFWQSTYPAFVTLRPMPCHVMILLRFPVFFLRCCLWRFCLWCWMRLELAALHWAVQGLSPHTVSAYRSGIRQCVAFYLRLHLQPLPLLDLMLCRFVSSLYIQHLSHYSIRSYLSFLRFLQILAGAQTPVWVHSPNCNMWCERWAVCPFGPIAPLGSWSLQTF